MFDLEFIFTLMCYRKKIKDMFSALGYVVHELNIVHTL